MRSSTLTGVWIAVSLSIASTAFVAEGRSTTADRLISTFNPAGLAGGSWKLPATPLAPTPLSDFDRNAFITRAVERLDADGALVHRFRSENALLRYRASVPSASREAH